MNKIEPNNSLIAGAEEISAGHWLTFILCFICDLFGGTVSTLMSVYLPDVAKDLLTQANEAELGKVSAYISSLYIFGWMFGGVLWGMLSDRMGRVTSVALAASCYALFTLFTGMATSWQWIVVGRFFSGFGVGGVLVVTTILISELWPERKRAIVIGILSIAFPIGIFSAGFINYLVTDWRHSFMLSALVPLSIGIGSIWLMRESERWKVTQTEKTNRVNKIKMLLSDDHRKNLIIGSITFGTMLIGLWAIFSWLPTWVQSLLGATDGHKARGLSMMLLGGGGLLGGFFSGWIANALGLRRTMIMCFSGCFIMSFLLFKINVAFSEIIYVETAILALFFGVSQGALSVYIPQLFPTRMRATATGFCFNVGRLVTATIVFFVGALVTVLGGYGNAIFSFSLIFLLGLAAILLAKNATVASNQIINQPTD